MSTTSEPASTNETTTAKPMGFATLALLLAGVTAVVVRLLGGTSPSDDRPTVSDNKVLDQFTVPVGDWAEQIVDWVDVDMESKIGFDLLGVIKWPFEFLFSTFVRSGDYHPWFEISDMPWWGVCALFFVLGTAFRNAKVGLFAAVALALCGMLGIEYWDEVALTLGMVIVAVFLCAIIGIPLGVLCGRVDGVWAAVRPALDAMQVVHSFVLMLPFIFFFGIGFESSTMVTMIFAIPPLIRLTNLGIRQVPEDVVEAARAYGAPEWRVLLDVQLPLARQAIMTGLNQTLLLAISMLGIAALMGAGGLGLLVFRATTQLDVSLGASAGLALFTVAVVLDRISQSQASEGMNLFSRIGRVLAARRNPEELLADEQAAEAAAEEAQATVSPFAAVTGREQLGATVAAVGAVVTIIATLFATWGSGASLIGGYARRADLDIATTETFGGLAAEGGSWFGVLTLVGAFFVLATAATLGLKPGEVGPTMGADGALIGAAVATGTPLAYLVMSPSIFTPDYSAGSGPLLAAAGGLVAAGGAAWWLFGSPYTARTPLPAKVNKSRIFIAAACVVWAGLSGFAAWTFDERQDTVITPEVQAQIDDVIARASLSPDDPNAIPAAEAASEVARLNASAQQDQTIYDNYTADGPQLGTFALVLSIIGLALSVPAAGAFTLDEPTRWRWSVAVAAVGWAMMALAGAFVISILRVADANFVSGAGAFLYFVSGAFLTLTSRPVMREFRRAKVFAAFKSPPSPVDSEPAVVDVADDASDPVDAAVVPA